MRNNASTGLAARATRHALALEEEGHDPAAIARAFVTAALIVAVQRLDEAEVAALLLSAGEAVADGVVQDAIARRDRPC